MWPIIVPLALLVTACLYKIVAWVLSKRLKKVLPHTITEYQTTFVKGQQILDAFLLANELIDEWKSKKRKGVIIKLDIEKGFDKVD